MRHKLLLLLFVIPVACTRSADKAPDPSPQRETEFGHLGKVKYGGDHDVYEGKLPYYRDGDLEVYVAMAGYPGKSLGTAYVLILRLGAKDPRQNKLPKLALRQLRC